MIVALSCGTNARPGKPWLSALPMYDSGTTAFQLTATGRDYAELSLTRAITTFAEIHGRASTQGDLDLSVQCHLPLQLAPAFLSAEVSLSEVTGYLTLFFGPASIDLGRSWIQPERWAWAQVVVHPKLTFVVGVRESEGSITPQIGWRWFPWATAAWELSLTVAPNAMSFSIGGVP